MTATFYIAGKPQGKGRPRFTRSGHTYTPAKTKAYERAIQSAYKEQAGAYFIGPVSVDILCIYPIPKSRKKADKEAMRDGRIQPCVKPDLDNVTKAVCDALNGTAYADDACICTLTVRKQYGAQAGVWATITGNTE